LRFLHDEAYYNADGLRDSSEKPGEDFVQGFVPDLQRIARAKIDIKTILMIAPIAFSFLMFKLIYIFLKR
jgi:hypothetical protein